MLYLHEPGATVAVAFYEVAELLQRPHPSLVVPVLGAIDHHRLVGLSILAEEEYLVVLALEVAVFFAGG